MVEMDYLHKQFDMKKFYKMAKQITNNDFRITTFDISERLALKSIGGIYPKHIYKKNSM